MTQDQRPDAHRQRISLFVDGEADAAAAQSIASAWRDDPALRRTWHSYHLIGDVLRSDELAIAPSRDEQFLQRLRDRMALEPVVLAPAVKPSPPLQDERHAPTRAAAGFAALRSRRRRWQAPAAMAAGVVAVVGVAVMMRGGDPAAGGSPVVLAGGASSPITVVAVPAPQPQPVALTSPTTDPTTHRSIIRDPRIDSYFQAHRQFSLGGPLGIPAGYMRNDELAVPQTQQQQQR